MSLVMFDLGRAMRKKEEFESARLLDFEFRRRARATRALAECLGLSEAVAAKVVSSVSEDDAPGHIAMMTGHSVEAVRAEYARCVAVAHAKLIAERGDPAPHRLA